MCSEDYLHYAKQQFNTRLELDLLQEYLLIPLDIFMEKHHNIDSKLDAWLYFIASDQLEDVCRVVEKYPEFWELYEEVFRFRFQKEELISMYSDALRILDENTVQYMVEEQKEVIEAQRRRLEEKDKETKEQRLMIDSQRRDLEVKEQETREQREIIDSQRRNLEAKEQKTREQREVIDNQRREIERLRKLLNICE